jgi:hypothetical protein
LKAISRTWDRRPQLQRVDAADEAGKIIGQDLLQFCPHPLAGYDILGDDHRLGEEIVRQLDIERQIEADGAASHIGAPARDVGIIFQDIIEPSGDGFAGIDRGVLRQAQVDEKLRAV